jgi:Flp pilus assembly protein TadB
MNAAWSSIGPIAAGASTLAIGTIARSRYTRPTRKPSTTTPSGRSTTLRPRPLHSQTARRAFFAAAAIVLVVVLGIVVTVIAIAITLLVRRLGPIREARRQRAANQRTLPDAMDLLVLSVRAGLTPFQAVCDLATSDVHAIGEAFGEVVRRTERGQPFADALSALPEQLGIQAGGLADVIATSDRHGLPLGPVLDQLTTEVRATRRRLDQADARKLPIRLSFPLVACTLPSFVLLAIAPAVIAALSSLGGTAW